MDQCLEHHEHNKMAVAVVVVVMTWSDSFVSPMTSHSSVQLGDSPNGIRLLAAEPILESRSA